WCRRNPIVATLSGALVLTVLVALGGITFLYLNADYHRHDAEANFAEAKAQFKRAEKEREQAQTEAEERKKQYTRAERHRIEQFLAIDRFLTQVSEERLLRQPDMEGLRKNLLHSAVNALEEFAAHRSDSPMFERERGAAYGRL